MQSNTVQSCSSTGYHQIAYTEWGDPKQSKVLICAHGLTRTGRDFDALAEKMSDRYRVICFDFAGRGQSDWLYNKADYDYPQYLVDATVLIARLNSEHVTWLGTSMGGILGMTMASLPEHPIDRLIVNDVGPFVPKAALERIASYVGEQPEFDTAEQLEQFFRTNYASFGNLSDTHWAAITHHSQRTTPEGKLTLHYDPGIAEPFKNKAAEDVDFWPIWDRINTPTLVLRGEDSDLLMQETAEQMTQRGPKADLQLIAGCGHAPALMQEDQMGLIRDWLSQH